MVNQFKVANLHQTSDADACIVHVVVVVHVVVILAAKLAAKAKVS